MRSHHNLPRPWTPGNVPSIAMRLAHQHYDYSPSGLSPALSIGQHGGDSAAKQQDQELFLGARLVWVQPYCN
ncbi:hypothetical protein WJX79_004734 [Trebouxia sp. C0005]